MRRSRAPTCPSFAWARQAGGTGPWASPPSRRSPPRSARRSARSRPGMRSWCDPPCCPARRATSSCRASIAASGKTPGDAFGLAFNPEFMREGSSVADFNTPSRTIVGAIEQRSTRGGAFALQRPARRQDHHRHRNRRAGQICRQYLARAESGLHQRDRRRGQHVGHRQRRGDGYLRRGQPAQYLQGLYAAGLCLRRLMLAEGFAGARLSRPHTRSVAAGHRPHPRQQPDADQSRSRLDPGAFQEARRLSRHQLQVRNRRRARKPVCESRRRPERQRAARCASSIPTSISPICLARTGTI